MSFTPRRRPWERPRSLPGLLAYLLARTLRPVHVATACALLAAAAFGLGARARRAGARSAHETAASPALRPRVAYSPAPFVFAHGAQFVAVYELDEGMWTLVRLDAAGHALGTPLHIQYATNITAAPFRDGFVLACVQNSRRHEDDPDEDRGDLAVWWFDPARDALTRVYFAERESTNYASAPHVVVDGARGFTLYWSSRYQARLRALRFDQDHAPVGAVSASPSYGPEGREFELAAGERETVGVYDAGAGLVLLPALDPGFGAAPVPLTGGTSGFVFHLQLAPGGDTRGVAWTKTEGRAGSDLWFAALTPGGFVAPPARIAHGAPRHGPWVVALAARDGVYRLIYHAGGDTRTWSILLDAQGRALSPSRVIHPVPLRLSNLEWTGHDYVVLDGFAEDHACPIRFSRLSADAAVLTPPVCCF